MMGPIAGDMIGAPYEGAPIKTKHFPLFGPGSRFTDDTVLTVAVAQALLDGEDYAAALRRFGRCYPDAGYGAGFRRWLWAERPAPYYSWGNGAAMRVSPVGFAFDTRQRVLAEARHSAVCTHDHPEGVKGAQATALAVYLARAGADKAAMREELGARFDYDLGRTLEAIRPGYRFDSACQGSVPEAVIAFLESADFEDAVRNAVSLGGDSDTQACIAAAIAQAYYGPLPAWIEVEVRRRLPDELAAVVERFNRAVGL